MEKCIFSFQFSSAHCSFGRGGRGLRLHRLGSGPGLAVGHRRQLARRLPSSRRLRHRRRAGSGR